MSPIGPPAAVVVAVVVESSISAPILFLGTSSPGLARTPGARLRRRSVLQRPWTLDPSPRSYRISSAQLFDWEVEEKKNAIAGRPPLFLFFLSPFFFSSEPRNPPHSLPRPRQREDRRRHRGPRRRRRRPRLPPQERLEAFQGHLDLGLEKDVAEARRRGGGQGRRVAEAGPQARRRRQGLGAAARGQVAQGQLQGRLRRGRR